MLSRQQGFTLIELIVVVVILGILSAFALPKFFSLSGEARFATLEALAGNIRTAAALTHSKQVSAGLTAGATVTWGALSVQMINSYPRSSAAGIVAALENTDGFTVSYSGDGSSAAHTATFSSSGASATCQIVYTPPASNNDFPSVVVTGDADNCS
jgi:MSHA pilin protein MshA